MKPDDSAATAPLDFRRFDCLPQLQLDAIRTIQESFASTLAVSLSLYLRCDVAAELLSMEQIPFEELTQKLPAGACLAYLGMAPYSGFALAAIEPALLLPIVDRVLGGTGKTEEAADREVTEIELETLDGVFDTAARDLSETWSPVAPIQFTVDAREIHPRQSQRIAPERITVVAAVEVRIGESTGLLHLAIPSGVLKAMRQRLERTEAPRSDSSHAAEEAIRQKMARELWLDVECAVEGARVQLREILNLQPGQILDLGIPIDSPACARFNGNSHFRGDLVVSGGKTAIRIQPGE